MTGRPTHIVTAEVPTWDQPDPSASPSGRLPAGTQVEVVRDVGQGWVEIRFASGWRGYTATARLRPIDQPRPAPPSPPVASVPAPPAPPVPPRPAPPPSAPPVPPRPASSAMSAPPRPATAVAPASPLTFRHRPVLDAALDRVRRILDDAANGTTDAATTSHRLRQASIVRVPDAVWMLDADTKVWYVSDGARVRMVPDPHIAERLGR